MSNNLYEGEMTLERALEMADNRRKALIAGQGAPLREADYALIMLAQRVRLLDKQHGTLDPIIREGSSE